jgi:hypothetical protein
MACGAISKVMRAWPGSTADWTRAMRIRAAERTGGEESSACFRASATRSSAMGIVYRWRIGRVGDGPVDLEYLPFPEDFQQLTGGVPHSSPCAFFRDPVTAASCCRVLIWALPY